MDNTLTNWDSKLKLVSRTRREYIPVGSDAPSMAHTVLDTSFSSEPLVTGYRTVMSEGTLTVSIRGLN